jgi:hypothetical protein
MTWRELISDRRIAARWAIRSSEISLRKDVKKEGK